MKNEALNVTDKPLAAEGLLSYRCKGQFGWIMIGAKDDDDAFSEALRSCATAKREGLQKWDGTAYVPCTMPEMRQAYVIVEPEMGIYLGGCMGLGFWTKLDPAGQPSAVTFTSQKEAEDHMATWDSGRPEKATLHPVQPDDGEYASVQACVNAGLEGWIDNYMEMASPLAQ